MGSSCSFPDNAHEWRKCKRNCDSPATQSPQSAARGFYLISCLLAPSGKDCRCSSTFLKYLYCFCSARPTCCTPWSLAPGHRVTSLGADCFLSHFCQAWYRRRHQLLSGGRRPALMVHLYCPKSCSDHGCASSSCSRHRLFSDSVASTTRPSGSTCHWLCEPASGRCCH